MSNRGGRGRNNRGYNRNAGGRNQNNSNNNNNNRHQRSIRDDKLSMNAIKSGSSEFGNNFYHWFRKWENAELEQANIFNKKQIDKCVLDEQKSKDEAIKIFADIMASMSEESQNLVKEYSRTAEVDDEGEENMPEYTFETAMRERNWYFLFEAARETHVKKLSAQNDTGLRKRQNSELATLKSLAHKKGLVTAWVQSFEDQMDRLESTGYELRDIDKRMIFMDNLNQQIFSTVLSNWDNDMMRDNFPSEYKSLKTYIIRQFEMIRLNNPEIVNRVERGAREEMSFKAAPSKCEICEGNHKTDDPEYSIKSNKYYMQRKTSKETSTSEDKKATNTSKPEGKSETDKVDGEEGSESKWNPTKGTIVEKPKKKKEKTGRLMEMKFSDKDVSIKTVTVDAEEKIAYEFVDNAPEKPLHQLGRSEYASPSNYVFIYDTGTVTGCVTPDYADTIRELFEEQCTLEGQGGGVQTTDLAGTNTFGMFRQLKTSNGNMNLISHIEAEKCWQLVHPRPGYLQLRELPDRVVAGKIWHIYSDKNIMGGLPLLTISKNELPWLL